MSDLRDKENGCPWDCEQNFKTIAPYTIEEAYEVADAIERDNLDDLKDELGDLLLQVVFHSQMAKEENIFTFDDVVEAICEKLIRRHPHVFGANSSGKNDELKAGNAEEVPDIWEEQKRLERKKKQQNSSVLDGITVALPAITRSIKLQKRAAETGFDWEKVDDIFDKLDEEVEELRQEIPEGDMDKITDEMGDVLFVCTNIARRLGVDPERAMRGANKKFEKRFKGIEEELKARGIDIKEVSLADLDNEWQKQKGRVG